VGSVDAFPSLDQLRSRPDLQRLVDQQVREDNLWSRQEVTEGNIQQNLIGNFGAPPPVQQVVVSGRSQKSESGVIRTIVWPHTRLEGRLPNPTFEKLDFINLFFGELGVLEECQLEERRARAKQLKRLLIFSQSFSWETLRNFHGSYLAAVEKSDSWQIDVNELVSELLFSVHRAQPQPQVPVQQVYQVQQYQPVQQVVQPGPQPPQLQQQVPPYMLNPNPGRKSRYFCSYFNQGSCIHGGVHRSIVGGRTRTVEHFCAHCFIHYREIQAHPEKDCSRALAKKASLPKTQENPAQV